MQDIIDSLDACVQNATFALRNSGSIEWYQYRKLFRNKRWGDSFWMHLAGAELCISSEYVAHVLIREYPD